MGGDEYIRLPELAMLGAFLGGPVYLGAVVLQGAYLIHRGVSWSRGPFRLVSAVAASAVAAYVLTFALWVAIPFEFMDWPGTRGDWPYMFLGVVFVPALLAAVVTFPLVTWGALRSRSAAQQIEVYPQPRTRERGARGEGGGGCG